MLPLNPWDFTARVELVPFPKPARMVVFPQPMQLAPFPHRAVQSFFRSLLRSKKS